MIREGLSCYAGDSSDVAATKRPTRDAVKSLLRALASGSSGSMALAQTLLVRFLTLGLNVLTGVLVARYLGPVGRAEQAAILLGAGLFPFLVSFGLPYAVQYKIRTDPNRASEIVSAGTVLAIAFGLIACVAGIFIVPHMLAQYSATIVFAAQLAMLTAPLAMLYALLCGVLQAGHQFRETNFTRYAMPVSTLLILLGLVVGHALNPISSAVAYLAAVLWAVPWLWVKVSPRLRITGLQQATRGLVSYGSRSYVSEILGTLVAQVDQVLVIGLLSPSSMGLYTVAIGAARAVDLFSGSTVAVLFPRAASLEHAQIVELTGRAARITSAMLLATSVGLIALMPLLLPLFYGQAFKAAVPVAQVIVVSIALNAVVYILAQAYMAAGRPGINALIQLVGLATTVPAMLLLIPRYALLGAASALVISTIVRLLFLLACFPIALNTPIPSLLLNAGDVLYVRRSLARQMRGK
jgi:O-antigen/teichoic acid export membrane protein